MFIQTCLKDGYVADVGATCLKFDRKFHYIVTFRIFSGEKEEEENKKLQKFSRKIYAHRF